MAGKTFPGGESGWQRVDSGGPFGEHIQRPKRLGDMSDDRADIRNALTHVDMIAEIKAVCAQVAISESGEDQTIL